MHLDASNLYGWAMSQKLPVNGFKWVKSLSQFNESFIRDYNENSDIGYFLEVDIDYPEKLFNFHKDLPFLRERIKVDDVEKLICSIEDKEKYVIHIRVLTLFRMGFFGAAQGLGGGAFLAPIPKIHHTYPTMMKFATVIPYLRKIKKIYKSRDTSLEFS